MTFCFLTQNFAEIGQSADELWPKKRFSRWRLPPSWILKISIFGHMTVIGFNICCSVPNFIQIGLFSLRYGDLMIFKIAAVCHLGFFKFASFCPVALVDMPFCFLIQNFAEIGQLAEELWPKKRFSRWRPPPSWIIEVTIFGHVTVIGFNICCSCSVPNFIKIGWFFTEIWWFSDL